MSGYWNNPSEEEDSPDCPECGQPSDLLREEAGGVRFFVCSSCGHEWFVTYDGDEPERDEGETAEDEDDSET